MKRSEMVDLMEGVYWEFIGVRRPHTVCDKMLAKIEEEGMLPPGRQENWDLRWDEELGNDST